MIPSTFILASLFFCYFGFERVGGTGVFLVDMSRLADDWTPAALCRADCLDTLGKIFGTTTVQGCIGPFQECGSCWDECACAHFNPLPRWPVCFSDDDCYAGCRRARSFVGQSGKHRPNNGGIEQGKSGQEYIPIWRVISSAVLDGSVVRINTTVVDQHGNKYAAPQPHLIFSVSFKDSNGTWIQLSQEVNFLYNISLPVASKCHGGCDLRVVVVNRSTIVADSVFRLRAPFRLTIVPSVNTSSDTSVSAHFTLDASNPYVDLSNMSVTIAWTSREIISYDKPWLAQENSGSVAVYPKDNRISLHQLKYNAVYNVKITADSGDAQTSVSITFQTPACADPDGTLTYCNDEQTALVSIRASSPVWIIIVVIIVAVFVLCVCFFVVVLIYRMRARCTRKPVRRTESQHPLYTTQYLSVFGKVNECALDINMDKASLSSLHM
ncbi:uncharacterized protein LOC129591220 [Paramacrobiotus metropolitanus]|uniref:uncharacterized protein LOC129591220 n=1 Tax=Paramacrobiotus metropolitanus TaxID=2943436 RepID=UPI002445C333|nr:uncharacterized protein LOC129591220 [Paramacrobiotus metropolitanus]